MNKWLKTGAAVMIMAGMLATPAIADDTQRLNTHLQLVDSYSAGGYYDKAQEHITAALELTSPEQDAELCANLYLKQGSICLQIKEYDNALAALDKALEINPELTDALLYKAQAYIDSGMNTEAAEILNTYVEKTGDNTVYSLLAQIYEASGDNQKALDAYETFVNGEEEQSAEQKYTLAVYRMSLGMYSEAMTLLEEAKADETYKIPSSYNLALCKMNTGDYEGAKPELDACVEAGASYDGVYYNRAVCNMMVDDYAAAIEDFGKSIESESYAQDALYNQAICTMSMSNNAEAVELFTKYLETYPDSEQKNIVTYYRGVCLLSNGDYEKAIEDFDLCLAENAKDYDSMFYRGLSNLQLGNYKQAEQDFTECINNSEQKDRGHYYRALTYEAQDQLDLAIRDLTKCIVAEYDLFNSYQARARIYQTKGDEEKYLADLEASLNY